MKISITDNGSGIAKEFGLAIGATLHGRYIHIPESKGSGYLTGFAWGRKMRMMIRNYHLKEDIFIERTNELDEGQEDLIFLLSGIFPAQVNQGENLSTEHANILICRHAVSSIMAMPSNTVFGSVTIAVSKQYLRQIFGQIDHPVVKSVLEAGENFVFEPGISDDIIYTANEMLLRSVPESMENHFYKLKCEELLCFIMALLIKQDVVPSSAMHITDIKAIYAVKTYLQLHLDEPPHIALLSKEAGMSEPKLRKLFKQTFGKGVFEYYQTARMQRAAQLLKEKRLTVSEVGFQMGFTNLSHFSRVFERFIGLKPKKFSAI